MCCRSAVLVCLAGATAGVSDVLVTRASGDTTSGEEGLARARLASELDPLSSSAALVAAIASANAGDAALADAYLERARGLDPFNPAWADQRLVGTTTAAAPTARRPFEPQLRRVAWQPIPTNTWRF